MYCHVTSYALSQSVGVGVDEGVLVGIGVVVSVGVIESDCVCVIDEDVVGVTVEIEF